MKKILFDASVHLGQFALNNEPLRIWAKQSQVSISKKGKNEILGLYTFNENGWMDRVIWDLDRVTQDTFYPFMDLFYSVKEIHGIPLDMETAQLLSTLTAEHPNEDAGALLICAAAIVKQATEIHTAYPHMNTATITQIAAKNSIIILQPGTIAVPEAAFEEQDLEEKYATALEQFKKNNVDVSKQVGL